MHTFFGVLAGLLSILSAYPYVRDILKNETKPHRASFLIWTVLDGIAFFTQLAKHATWSLLLPAGDALAVGLIFVLSFKNGVGGYSIKDRLVLLVAACGLIIWYFTKDPLLALLIIIGIDLIGTILTVIKSYQEPDTETFSSWALAALAGLAAILAVSKISFSLLVYPAYMLLASAAIDFAIILGKNLRKTKQPQHVDS